ncbi:DGQHR domain-containing protein [Belliella marina]|uniref:DGQHR domain-containing protein n=1 Tax=Belliella marina TaxID=1644146 RepID=A0ABW4VT95_9BACT
MAKAKPKTKSKRSVKLTPHEKEKNAYRKEVRGIFGNSGFTRVGYISDKEFIYNGAKSDFDDVYIYENIIILIEYTVSKADKVGDHLKPKKIVYDEILKDTSVFLDFYENKFPSLKETRSDLFDSDQCKVIILYCAKYNVKKTHQDLISGIKYFNYPTLRYFKSVTDAIKLSSRFELFHFLGLSINNIGMNSILTSNANDVYEGSILPHSHSNFPRGYKVVSFYVDPDSLLERSYVLRSDGWRDEVGLYQRMISKAKISAIRKYLKTEGRVFINNIIVTLPSTTKLLDKNRNTVDPDKLTKTEPGIIEIPKGYNYIGLIDGQHRVFAYHEGGLYEDNIAKMRKRQNLLVTGIIYPPGVKSIDKTKFEANLFLEINSTQTNAKSDLKQTIGLMLKPFSSESIAKAVINRLNGMGALEDMFEKYFFDRDKIKTTSIVSYGLKPIVKLSGTDSFFSIWDNENKNDLLNNSNNEDLLSDYISFCSENIDYIISAIKQKIDLSKWTTDRNVKNKVLNTTAINGIIICQRLGLEDGIIGNLEFYKEKFDKVNSFDFSSYKSSQYASMGRDLYTQFLSKK